MTVYYWRLPQIWDSATCVIIAGGPSLDLKQIHHVARARLSGKCVVIAVNDAVYPAWWADWLHSCDRKWWDWHIQSIHKFPGIKTTLDETLPPRWGVHPLHNTGCEGFDPDPTCCRTGASGAYQVMHCAIHAGAGKIILLGVDMKADGESHWFGEHPNPARPDYQTTMVPRFELIVPELDSRGIEVVNCSPGTALKTFPTRSIEEALR